MANQAQPIPQVWSHLVQLNIEFQVLICTSEECQCAVSPVTIVRHLHRHHKVPIELRKQVERYIQGFPGSYDHRIVQLPADRSIPQPIIPVVSGFQCCECPFKTQDRSNVRKHANKEHGKKRVDDEELFTTVRMQSWFKNGKERYWVVVENKEPIDEVPITRQPVVRDVGEEGPAESPEESDSEQEATISYDKIEGDIQQWKADAQERRLTLLAKPPIVELDPWLRYTKWYEVLDKSKHDLVRTYEFLREPEPNEPNLHRVVRAWKRIFNRCLNTLEAMDHKDTLKWWGSPKNEEASVRPFELPQNAKSLAKYSTIWEQFICYVIRTSPEEFGDETETGVQFTMAQWESIKRIEAHLEGSPQDDPYDESKCDEELTSELMNLCQLVLMQDTSRIPLYESPLMHYLAVRGVDTHAKAFRSSFFYTPILAGALWIARVILLEVAIPLEGWPRLGLKSKGEIHSIPVRIHKIRTCHLCEGSYSPTSSILTQLAMGKKTNSVHESPSNIHWAHDFQTIYFGGMPIELGKVRTMGLAMMQESHELLKELSFDQELPVVDLSNIVDSMAWSSEFRRSDYSFISCTKNDKSIRTGHSFLLERAKQVRGKGQMIDASYEEARWVDRMKGSYLVTEKQFLRKFMVILHITGGQPARGPELGSIKASNSIYSARNIYVINGRMCFLTMYDKARKRRGNSEYIVRGLPDQVSQMLAQYLVFVRPFSRALDRRESEFLFADERGPWAGEQLSRELAKASNKHLGVRLTVSSWRHVAIGIAVQHLMHSSKVWEKDEPEEEEFAEGDNEEELEDNAFDHVIVRQSGHGQRVAQAHYAIDGGFLHRLGPQLISAFERASIAWHGLFGWKSEGAGDGTKTEKHGRQASQQLRPEQVKKERRGTNPKGVRDDAGGPSKAMIGLQRIYGAKAKAQSEGQASALEMVHRPPRTSIIVLPTSSGKSVLFFSVAAMVVQQTVIVVVPFRALIDDMIVRGESHGLSCEEWVNERSCHEMRQLVIVSADQAVRTEFLHWAKGLELKEQLAHVFFDEGHVAFTDRSYRTKLRDLWKLRYLDCPFTVLTATLMVQLEETLRAQLLIPDAVLFRRSTVRPTIQYQVMDSQNKAPFAVAIEFIQGVELGLGAKGVIYVRSYAIGELISSELNCAFYKATAEAKSELLDRWVESSGWIVATGALGTGINIQGIVYVVHVDRPYGLTSFVQQSGRGGRGGEVSKSVMIVRAKTTRAYKERGIMSEYSVEQIDEDALTEFVRSKGCRRLVLGRYMDGEEGTDCREMDWAYCDVCYVRSGQARLAARVKVDKEEEEEGGSNIIAGRSYEEEEATELMFKVMKEFRRQCIYCMMIHGDGVGESIRTSKVGNHSYEDCLSAEGSRCGEIEFQQWREGMQFPQGDDCYECGLSQRLCQGVEDGTECEYPMVVFPGIFILHQHGYLEEVVRSIGFQGSYEKEGWEWMWEMDEGVRSLRESNWDRTWQEVCIKYVGIREESGINN